MTQPDDHHRLAPDDESPATSDPREPSRYLVGIDLGTTNSAVAYIDSRERWTGEPPVHTFEIPQLVAEGAIAPRATLPSFLYMPGTHELPEGATVLPWVHDRRFAVGEFARDQGARVPGRLVSSAKSWLCHGDVDRTAPILPWGGSDDVQKLSPVAVSAQYLQHIREAWDAHMAADDPSLGLAGQDLVLTVPASFDEVARELTLAAAEQAGLERVTLLEEPQAAFYAWLANHASSWADTLCADQVILVCDIGGGTTDFSLIVVREGRQGLRFERVAVGEHLMLGGDNMDLALARLIEERLKGQGAKLDAQAWAGLTHACRAGKETLLGDESVDDGAAGPGGSTATNVAGDDQAPASPPNPQHPAGWPAAEQSAGERRRVPIGVVGSGSSIVGSFLRSELSYDEASKVVIDGFFPLVPADEEPERRKSGLREWGLPYVADAAVTRHLAEFLRRHRTSVGDLPGGAGVGLARPDLVLWNGAALTPPAIRARLLDAVTAWFRGEDADYQPALLENPDLRLAVAHGAAYYGVVRRGRGVRIHGGSARGYYVAVEGAAAAADPELSDPISSVCLVRRGTEEGETVELERAFEAHVNKPVAFALYSSSVRTDSVGDLVLAERESLLELPPIRTMLRFGKKTGERLLPVRLGAHLTEVGTLELFCSSSETDHRWRLRFQVRHDPGAEESAAGATIDQGVTLEEEIVESLEALVRAAFVPGATVPDSAARVVADGEPVTPENLMRRLRDIFELERQEWPLAALRKLAEILLEVGEHRRRSPAHEARWLNLIGFCLRPGFGYPMDEWRLRELWKISHAGVLHPASEPCRTEWWILWRRVAAGLSRGQQEQLSGGLVAPILAVAAQAERQGRGKPGKRKGKGKGGAQGSGKVKRLAKQERVEMWMCAASLEQIDPRPKVDLGRVLVDQVTRGKATPQDLWALARIGARVPFHGHANQVVQRKAVEGWIASILKHDWQQPDDVAHMLAHLARRSGDRQRDIGDALRSTLLERLRAAGDFPRAVELVAEGGELGRDEGSRVFGEALPAGLVLVEVGEG